MGFGLGLVKGIATSVNRNLMQSMEDYKDKIDLLTATNVKTAQQREADYNERMTSVTGSLGDIKRAVDNDLGVVQYLVDEYGLEGAKEKADLINSLSKKTGKVRSAAEIVGLVRDPNNTITLDKLAKSLIPAPSQIYTDAKIEPTGLMKLFDDDISDDVRRETEAMLGAAGIQTNYGEMKLLDPVYTDDTRGVREWELYAPDDFKKSQVYHTNVSFQLKQRGFYENNPELLKEAAIVQNKANNDAIMVAIEAGDRKPLTQPQKDKYLVTIYERLAINWMGSAKETMYQDGLFTGVGIDQLQKRILMSEAMDILEIVNSAKMDGASAVDIDFYVNNAINNNYKLIYTTPKIMSGVEGVDEDMGSFSYAKNDNGDFTSAINPYTTRGSSDPANYANNIFPDNAFRDDKVSQELKSFYDDPEIQDVFKSFNNGAGPKDNDTEKQEYIKRLQDALKKKGFDDTKSLELAKKIAGKASF